MNVDIYRQSIVEIVCTFKIELKGEINSASKSSQSTNALF